ncbi:hypothetical protein CesoFtcFv8_025239 [Champsocephalus esox]|uniref:Nucleolar MIF4G domain-containing protein 1 n=1 Tax=Champsocephalus esox TaxID=159716 RepID=A0AAN8GC58_9TELE|nr:hypothetical protein CesoFtcFv8_025239 [Champsocephalus esox]
MKGKWKQNTNKKKGNEVLEKCLVAVDEFIKKNAGEDDGENDHGLRFVKKKSRKDMRKETRKFKKAKMKNYYEGNKSLIEPPNEELEKHTKKKRLKKKKKPKVDEEEVSTSEAPEQPNKSKKPSKKVNTLQESRKIALLEANEQEDREIKKLERCLGLNKRKNKKSLPQSFVTDGLDYILGILDSGSNAEGMYDEDEDMEMAKNNFEKLEQSDSEEEEEDGEEEEEESDEDMGSIEDETKTPEIVTSGKYVPPHLRNAGDDKRRAELEKMKRTVKGLVNRLSEPNMAWISGQLEELYMSSSRKDMTDMLTEVLLSACVSSALMPDRLLMEHVLLISILHHAVGLEVGAHFLETVVRQFDEVYKNPSETKECDNLISIICHLYNFQVVHSVLVFDILKHLVGDFREKDIELVLLVLRNVGFALRKDDALALKELICEGQRKAVDVGTKFQDQTRVRFMLETMLALKNNDMRKIPGYDPEPMEKLRKLQRTLVQRRAGGSDMKLRVSLDNLLAADQIGRWWIVGSSWSGAPMIGEQNASKESEGKFSAKVLDLARKQRMNTEVRRNIFCVVMTSEDFMDAFEKLIRMGLKDKQEREIVNVLMDCCLQEKTFNGYYAVLGEKFCSHDRRFQMTFQFSLWDKFRDLSSLPSSTFSNLVQLVSHFLQKKCLSLSILKVIEFGELDKATVRFLRQLLTKLLREMEPEELVSVFGRISGIPKLGMLREGLKLFISHFLLKSLRSQGAAEQAEELTERAKVASRAMEAKEVKLKL